MLRRSLRAARRLGDEPSILQLGAFDSFAQVNVAAHAQTQTLAEEVCIAAVALPIKYSGIFDVAATVVCSNNIAEATVQHKVVLNQYTSPATFFVHGNSLHVIYGNDLGADATSGQRDHFGQILTADVGGAASNGVTYNGVIPNSLRAGAVTLIDTTAIANQPGFGGMWVGTKTVAPKAPFSPITTLATPQIVVASVILVGTNGGDLITYGVTSLYMQERPLP